MTTDQDLLRQYAEEGREDAFAEVVRRQVDFVHSVARRVVAQDSHLAEDVTQRVFTDLARKAGPLSHHPSLAGWLHRTARYTAISAIRAEQRRRLREHEASTMPENTIPLSDAWEQLRPLLDAAVDELKPADREAVLLRFFHGQSHREVGEALGLSENSANKRIERALEKLRNYFSRHGITATAAMLAEAISANSIQAAPAGLADKVTPAALAGLGGVGVGGAFYVFLMSVKTKAGIAGILVVALVVTVALNLHYSSEQPAPAPATVKVAAATQVAAPALPAALPKDAPTPTTTWPETSTVLSVPGNDPQADLNTALPHLIDLIQTRQILDAFKQYMPPSYFASMPEPIKAQLKQQETNLLADPGAAKTREMVVSVLQDMLRQQPEMNEAGDRATYRSNANPFKAVFRAGQLTFVKINGRWFFAPGTEPGFF